MSRPSASVTAIAHAHFSSDDQRKVVEVEEETDNILSDDSSSSQNDDTAYSNFVVRQRSSHSASSHPDETSANEKLEYDDMFIADAVYQPISAPNSPAMGRRNRRVTSRPLDFVTRYRISPRTANSWFSDINTVELRRMVSSADASTDLRRKSVIDLTSKKSKLRHSSLPLLWPSGVGVNNIEDAIFNIFCTDEDVLPVGRFLKEIFSVGIRRGDNRIKELIEKLEAYALLQGRLSLNENTDGLVLSKEQFTECISGNIVLLNRLLRKKVIIPEWQDFRTQIEDIYLRCKENQDGNVATYIPQLSRVAPDLWGVSICTVDGQRLSFGDTKKLTCMQSVSKMFNYALAHRDFSSAEVHKYVGQEPSGHTFNELALDFEHKPHNPMINAGAILICALLKSDGKLADCFDYITDFYCRMGGGEQIGFNNAVFLSERDTADRNYALAYYMREHNCFPPNNRNLQETLDFYFQLCSVDVSCETAAVMAATFANGGICPTTDDNIISTSTVRDTLSLMSCCGMYDYSGKFAFEIGLPAKSGVSGLILVVIPNVMGIALWAPRLDRWGNSVRGVQFCQELVTRFNFHNYDSLKRTSKKLDPRRPRTETKGQMVVNLLFSAANGDVTALRRYYLQGFDLSICDYDGRTALHLAAAEGHIECVQFLLEKCAVSPLLKDRWEHMPVDDAKMNKHLNICTLLEGEMAKHQLKSQRGASRIRNSPSGDSGVGSSAVASET